MTNITELAQRMKAAAVRAKAATEDYVAHRMSITVYLEESKEFNDLSDGPDNILALVEALEKAQQRIAQMESRTVTPVTYSENADADHCRKWAWEQVKGEVETEGWTTGDNITYFGFFCWGWDMRRQYNEQRPVTVNLPDDFPIDGGDCGPDIRVMESKKVIEALRAAGIKWEAE